MKRHLRNTIVAHLPLALLATLSLPPSAAEAQTVPGVQRDGFPNVTRYRAEVFQDLKTSLDEWERSVLEGDPDPLRELYADEAILLLEDGTTLIGSRQVAEQVLERFSRADRIELHVLDFDMSDRIAVVGGRMTLRGAELQSPGGRCFSMAFRREGRAWRIRSQTFCELPEQVSSSP